MSSPAMSSRAKAAPLPGAVDVLATAWHELEEKIAEAKAEFDATVKDVVPQMATMKTELIELVRDFGSTHAEKSKRLNGVLWYLQATFGTSHKLDAAAVERFRLALVKAKQARLLKSIFKKSVRWDLSPEAPTLIHGKLSPSLLALYARCDVPTPISPSLKVEKKTKEPAAA